MSDPATIAQAILRVSGFQDRHMPSDEDLVSLARAYLAVGSPAANLHPSLAAVEQFAFARGMRGEIERARRQLTAILRGAKPTAHPREWRVRKPIDMSLVVGPDDDAGTDLLIVHSVNVRGARR